MAMLLILLSTVAVCGCSIGVGLQVHRAPRCAVQRVDMAWSDGQHTVLALNVCRYGAIGRPPTPEENR